MLNRLNNVKKKTFYILSGFLLLLGIFSLYENRTTIKISENKTIKITQLIINEENVNQSSTNTKNYDLEVSPHSKMTYQELQRELHDDVINWEKEHFGYYYSEFSNSDYSSYDISTLIEMGKLNNIRALDMLGYKYEELKEYKQALSAHYKAAFLGSTAALQKIARLTDGKLGTRENTLHRLSFSQAAYLRGDQKAVYFAGMRTKILESPLNQQEKENVQKKGAEIFTHLVNERKKMGLSEFNENIPEYVNDFYSQSKLTYSNVVSGESPLFIKYTNH